MNIKQQLVFTLSLLFSASTLATSKWSGDWFEIEVILLSQLDDKNKLKEVFTDYSLLPQYEKSIDLLAPYLNPDITSLKQQLPSCDNPIYPPTLLQQATKLPEFHSILSLSEMEDIPSETTEVVDLLSEEYDELNGGTSSEFSEGSESVYIEAATDDFFDRVQTQQEQVQGQSESVTTKQLLQDDENISDINGIVKDEKLSNGKLSDEYALINGEITAKQLELVAQAETAFTERLFVYSPLATQLEKLKLCSITETQFNALNTDKTRFTYLGFSTPSMPTRINGAEDLFSEHAYLTSSDSLQLNDIVKQLRRSKNFRPLLHMAWRQQVFEEPSSTPIKLYAGDNLNDHYINMNARYQEAKRLEEAQEQALLEVLKSGQQNTVEENLTKTNQLLVAKTQHIDNILANVSSIADAEQVVSNLNSKNVLSSFGSLYSDNLIAEKGPAPPIQPWFLEGYLNVYLRGVFLNISADFNVMSLTLAEQESLKLRPNNDVAHKAVRFQQKRRVISREVHYFDHPYMGMIVQIRRHKRPVLPEPQQALENEEATL